MKVIVPLAMLAAIAGVIVAIANGEPAMTIACSALLLALVALRPR